MFTRLLVDTNILLTIASLLCIATSSCNTSRSVRTKISTKTSIEKVNLKVDHCLENIATILTQYHLPTSYQDDKVHHPTQLRFIYSSHITGSRLIRGPPFLFS